MVKTGGINVTPVEVEEVLMSHPGVQAAFVTGVPDAVQDEMLAALIIPKPGATLTEQDITSHCRKALAAYKVPRLIRFVTETELPLTTTGKLQKNRSAKDPGLSAQASASSSITVALRFARLRQIILDDLRRGQRHGHLPLRDEESFRGHCSSCQKRNVGRDGAAQG